MELTKIKGVGEKTSQLLNKLRIYSTEDLISYYPKNYDIYEEPITIDKIDNKLIVAIDGTIVKNIDVKYNGKSTIVTTNIKDSSDNIIKVTWFNMPFLKNTLKYSMRFVFRGRIKYINSIPVMEQPEIFTLAKYEEKLYNMQPLYSLTKGITNNQLSKIIKTYLESNVLEDYLPEKIKAKYQLCDYDYAIRNIHFPENFECLKIARKRLVFDEFFSFIYNMKRLKEKEILVKNQYIVNNHSVSDYVIGNLEYNLTDAQKNVISDIRIDIAGDVVMQRLVQGDVGSGKTIVAFLAMLDFAAAGLQSVIMAPTEVLAEQHYANMLELLKKNNLDFEAVLLTGALTQKQKLSVYEKIYNGEALLIIGTHAVFQEKVKYNNLSLVVIDEQHRFGVLQRANLMSKGLKPHVLVMSATPIPRTLAIILYGDMDISVINELPANRLSIKNCVVTKEYRPKAYKFIENQIKSGRQAYVICPMVEESDTLEAENVIDYCKVLRDNLEKNIVVEYLHGKMRPDEKNDVLRRFEKNEINVLVSTTVVEVGINVPNATVMMVENAERFGLSSLHQLRGRVGRGDYQSYCIFVSATSNTEKLKKLEILNKSNDGFFIASEDLKLRGPGDFFGIRQSGDMEFVLADIYTDADELKKASQAVEEFLNDGYEFIDKKLNNDIFIY
jgi:ATP-dependent DNA helicase RecG